MRVLGVIPARGGSKSIQKKNIVPLLGRPLIAYSIIEALKSRLLTKIIVSSDDEEIIRVAKKYGVEAPFIRPKELATDDALAVDVIRHAVLWMEEKEKVKYDYVVMLQPTTPLRTAEDIDNCLQKLFETNADSVISVVNVGAIHPYRMKIIDEEERLLDYSHEEIENMPRQYLPPVYIRSGAVYAVKRDVLVEKRSFKGSDCRAYVMPEERSVNIDSPIDLLLAEAVMKYMDWSYVKPVNSIQVTWRSWYGNEKLNLEFPEEWRISLVGMKDAEAVSDEQIREAILNPIGSPRLFELASGKKTACIAVDDLTKPTEAFRIAPYLIEELLTGGVDRDGIFFVISLGSHRALTHEDMVKKLGEDIVAQYRIYNHNPYQNIQYLGETSFGTPVYVNRFFLSADLRIGLGGLMPHPYAGFSGGGKIVMPGLAGIESIDVNHKPVNLKLQGTIGRIEGNTRRADIDEAARMAGLNFVVNVVYNSEGKTAGVFAGDVDEAFREATRFAAEVYATDVPYGVDIGVFNAFPRDNWFLLSLNSLNIWASRQLDREIVRKGGTIVIVNACSEGCGEHGLIGKGMKQHVRRDKHGTFRGPLEGRRLIFYSPNISEGYVADHYPSGVLLFKEWPSLIEHLRKDYGAGSRVAVFPCGPLQMDKNLLS